MSEELVKIEGALAPISEVDRAFEVDFSEIKKIKPFTVSIDQPGTEQEIKTPGWLRIVETGELRKSIKVVLVSRPRETRKMQIGKFPDKKLVCFSSDMISPHPDAPDAQAMNCAGCKQASWKKYNTTKDDNDKPHCEITSIPTMIDYDKCTPIKMYVRGKSRTNKDSGGGFEGGLAQVTQQFISLKMTKGSAAWTDVAMTLSTRKIKGNMNFALIVTDVHPLSEEERKHLSEILKLVAQQKAALLARREDEDKIADKMSGEESDNKDIADAVSNGSSDNSNPVEGEYVQGSVEEI